MAINYFDEIFFSKYIKDEDEVLNVCHKHIVTILDTIIIGIFFGAVLPTFFFYNNTFGLKDIIPFLYYEIYLFVVYIVLIYKIFDWYNDVWIITNKGVIDLDWQFMKTNIVYIDYSDIRGIELHQESMWDGSLGKGNITIHLEGEGAMFVLEDAKNPGEIVVYIQGILEESDKSRKEKEKTLTEKLFSTLRSVIKDHLDKNGFDEEGNNEENMPDEEKAINKALNKKGTIDLREQKE